MPIFEKYGLGGYCAECNPSHDHPLHNLIESYEYELPEEQVKVDELAQALSQLPADTLNALKQALGI